MPQPRKDEGRFLVGLVCYTALIIILLLAFIWTADGSELPATEITGKDGKMQLWIGPQLEKGDLLSPIQLCWELREYEAEDIVNLMVDAPYKTVERVCVSGQRAK